MKNYATLFLYWMHFRYGAIDVFLSATFYQQVTQPLLISVNMTFLVMVFLQSNTCHSYNSLLNLIVFIFQQQNKRDKQTMIYLQGQIGECYRI